MASGLGQTLSGAVGSAGAEGKEGSRALEGDGAGGVLPGSICLGEWLSPGLESGAGGDAQS